MIRRTSPRSSLSRTGTNTCGPSGLAIASVPQLAWECFGDGLTFDQELQALHDLYLGKAVMIIFGLILLVIGFIADVTVLWAIGVPLLVIGVVLWVLGSMGRAVGGRRHYW